MIIINSHNYITFTVVSIFVILVKYISMYIHQNKHNLMSQIFIFN